MPKGLKPSCLLAPCRQLSRVRQPQELQESTAPVASLETELLALKSEVDGQIAELQLKRRSLRTPLSKVVTLEQDNTKLAEETKLAREHATEVECVAALKSSLLELEVRNEAPVGLTQGTPRS